ncbi:hypothetical protein EON67_06175, partial [archaeon]
MASIRHAAARTAAHSASALLPARCLHTLVRGQSLVHHSRLGGALPLVPFRCRITMASAAGGAAGAAPRIHALPFDNRTLRALPIDPEPENFVRRVSNAVFSRVKPAAVTNPTLVAVSAPALALLG